MKLPRLLITFLGTSFSVLAVNYLASFFNYFFHILVGRTTDLSGYGQIESLLSLSLVIGLISSALTPSVIRLVANLPDTQMPSVLRFIEGVIQKLGLLILLVLVLIYLPVSGFLKIDQPWLYFLFAIQTVLALYFTGYLSLFQGRLKIPAYLTLGFLLAVLKNIYTYLLSLAGFGSLAANTSLVLSSLTCIVLAKVLIRRFWPHSSSASTTADPSGFWSYSQSALATNSLLTFILISDTLLARYYLETTTSAVYLTASLIAKIVFFSTSSVLALAFPQFVVHQSNLPRLRLLMIYSLLVTLLLGLGSALALLLNPAVTINLLYGNRFISAASYLPLYVVFIFLYSLLYMIVQFFLAQNRREAVLISILVLTVQIVLFIFLHDSETSLLAASAIASALGVVLGLGLTLRFLNPAASLPAEPIHPGPSCN